jgi:hypothetical protein
VLNLSEEFVFKVELFVESSDYRVFLFLVCLTNVVELHDTGDCTRDKRETKHAQKHHCYQKYAFIRVGCTDIAVTNSCYGLNDQVQSNHVRRFNVVFGDLFTSFSQRLKFEDHPVMIVVLTHGAPNAGHNVAEHHYDENKEADSSQAAINLNLPLHCLLVHLLDSFG